jgi:hypothetical protein
MQQDSAPHLIQIEEPEDYYSEIEYLSPFEIRSLASILLSLRGDLNYLGLYPAPYAIERRYVGIDLSDVATVPVVEATLSEGHEACGGKTRLVSAPDPALISSGYLRRKFYSCNNYISVIRLFIRRTWRRGVSAFIRTGASAQTGSAGRPSPS